MIYTKDDVIRKSDFSFDMFNGSGRQYREMSLEEMTVHNHDCLEINYVVHGGGYYIIGDKKYELETGDICLINNEEYHMAFNTGLLMLKVIVFSADLIWDGSRMDYMYLKAFFERKKCYEPFIKANDPIAKIITPIIFEIDQEWKEKKPGYQIMIKVDLMKLLATIYRYYCEENLFDNGENSFLKNYHYVTQAVDYINSHYSEQLTLKNISEMVHLSENYFSAIFSEVMQMPFSKYVLEKRLNRASVLIKSTKVPIMTIALQTGFSNISYFNKAFKKKYGLSPRQYRVSGGEE